MAVLSAFAKSNLYNALWRDVVYGDGKFVAVANAGQVGISEDRGATWQGTSSYPYGYPLCAAYGNGVFSVLSESSYVSWSTDAKTWTHAPAIANNEYTTWQAMIFAAGKFVAVSSTGKFAVSTDGKTYTIGSLPTTGSYTGIAYGNGKFIACVRGGVAVSENGQNWSYYAAGDGKYWQDIAFQNGVFVLSGQAGEIAYSTNDGATWTIKKIESTGMTLSVVTAGNGIFVVVASNSTFCAWSRDGVNWTAMTMAYSSRMRGIAYGDSMFVVVGDSPSLALYATSNSPPTAPNGITVPTTVEGGKTLTVTWGAATDPDKNLAGYRLERKVDAGAWTQVYQGTLQTFTDTITFGWGTVTYRVKSYDQDGAESGYTTSPARTVANNRAPTISGSDGSIGTFSASFTAQSYTVNDADNDAVTVVETLDGAQLRSYKPTLGQANSLTFSADAWRNIRNGTHTLVITATDPKGAKAVRTWNFVKAQNTLTFTLSTPLPADSQPLRCIVTVLGAWPSGSTLKVEACNNANDAAPTWEDITSKVLARQKHYFANSKKTAAAWAVNVRVTLTRGSASGDCYIESVSGNFA